MVGVRQGSGRPKQVTVEAGRLNLKGSSKLSLSGGAVAVSGSSLDASVSGNANIESKHLDLKAQVYIRGELLEDFIRRVAAGR